MLALVRGPAAAEPRPWAALAPSAAGAGARAAALSLCLASASCGDEVLTLGVGAPVPEFADAGRRPDRLNTESFEESDATLTADLLEVFFISDREGTRDVWHAERSSRTEPFGDPLLLDAASSDAEEASPAISGDGLTLWFASTRAPGLGGMDVWCIRRGARGQAWDPPENVEPLNGPADELPRPPAGGGLVLPLASDRGGAGHQAFFAQRPSVELPFGPPEPLQALFALDGDVEDPFLSEDGRLLFFTLAAPSGERDLLLAWRAAPDDPFRDPIALDELNSPGDERDPFLSADQIRFFFSSARRDGGGLDIYATNVELPAFR